MIDLEPVVDLKDIEILGTLIERHYRLTGSTLAGKVLEHWESFLPKFVKVMPQDYRRALLQMEREKALAEQEMAAVQP
jgi:glutamate synthase (ferredoxin)